MIGTLLMFTWSMAVCYACDYFTDKVYSHKLNISLSVLGVALFASIQYALGMIE